MTVYKRGDEIFDTWLKDVKRQDRPVLLPSHVRSIEKCVEQIPSEYNVPMFRFKHRVCEFEFSHCGDGYSGSISAMSDWCHGIGENLVFRDYLPELRDIAFLQKPSYVWADGKRVEYVFTTVWKTYDMTDDEDEDYGEFKTELRGVVNVTNLIGLLHVPA
jgi:hypothetical protein